MPITARPGRHLVVCDLHQVLKAHLKLLARHPELAFVEDTVLAGSGPASQTRLQKRSPTVIGSEVRLDDAPVAASVVADAGLDAERLAVA